MKETLAAWANLALIPILCLLLRRARRAWHDRMAFERQVASLQLVMYITHERACGRVSLLWMTVSGFILSLVGWAPVSVDHILTGDSTKQALDRFGWFAGPLFIAGIVIVSASASVGWRYWPRWAVPPHERGQPSPRDERKASNRAEREARDRQR